MKTSADPLGRTTTYNYSNVGRLQSVTDPTSRVMTYGYDPAGQMTSKAAAGGNTYSYGYDALGRRTTATVGTQTWSATWDPGNLLTKQVDPAGRSTGWTYDTAGRMTGLTYPDGSTITYGYDTASRVSSIKPGEAMADTFTTTGTVVDASKWTTTLTATGTIVTQGNAAVLSTANVASSAAALTSKSAAQADLDVTFTYNPTDITAANAADVVVTARKAGTNEYRLTLPTVGGNAIVAKKVGTPVTQLASYPIPGSGVRRVRFQVKGTAVSSKVWQADLPEPAGWSSTSTDTAIAAAGSTGVSVTRVAGLNSVTIGGWIQTNPTNPPAAIATYTYNNDNQFTGEALVNGSRTWVYTTGRLTNYAQTLAATTTATAVGYDTTGRIKTETTGTLTKTYGYDLADQLTTVTPSTGNTTTYAYDKLGRRSSVKVGTAAATLNVFDPASQLTKTGTTVYAYDSAGRRATETAGTTVTTYAYDQQGRLASTTRGPSGGTATATITRGYDPDDNLTQVTSNGTQVGIDWDPTSGIPEPTVMGAQRYVRGPDGTISSRTGLVDSNLGRDMYGSITTPTATAQAAAYDPFGKPSTAATVTPKLGYRGEIVIDNLTYLRARNYDGLNGVFTTRDPLDGVNGTAVVGNAYHYGNNNPLSNMDPTGMSSMASSVSGTGDPSYLMQSSEIARQEILGFWNAGKGTVQLVSDVMSDVGSCAGDHAECGFTNTVTAAKGTANLVVHPSRFYDPCLKNPGKCYGEIAFQVLAAKAIPAAKAKIAAKLSAPSTIVKDAAIVATEAESVAVNGETAATKLGREMHKSWDYGPGFEKEFTLEAGGRVDAINFETREVIELKPNNPRAIRLGERQVADYIAKLNEQFPGDPWTGQVVTYGP